MPMYIVLGKFTQEGVENIKDSPTRLTQANKLVESCGGKITAFYYTLGRYDFVSISEGMSLDDALKALLTLGKGGAIRTETLIAFPADEAAKLIGELP